MENECYIFWHIFLDFENPELGKNIVLRQFNLFRNTGLLEYCKKIYIGYVSTLPFPFDFINDPKIQIVSKSSFGQEGVTTVCLKRFCDEQYNDSNILYLHNRGGSRKNNSASEDWTKMMEFFLIEKWKKSINMLGKYFTCGCEMYPIQNRHSQNEYVYHYSGNFWWSRCSYIKILPYPTFEDRFNQSENWILQFAGKSIDKNKFGVIHRTSKTIYEGGLVDIYVDRYPEKYYSNCNETPDIPIDSTNFTFDLWTDTNKPLYEMADTFSRRAKILRQDESKQYSQKGYEHMIKLGWYYGITHNYDEAKYWFDITEKNSYRFDNINQWFIFRRLLIPKIISTDIDEKKTIKTLLSNLDDILTNMNILVHNINIFDRSFWYAYLNVNPRIILEKYAQIQMKAFPQIVRQEKPKIPICKRIRIGIISKSLIPQERLLEKPSHSSSISDSFYATFLGLDPSKFEVYFIHIGKSSTSSVECHDGDMYTPDINNIDDIRNAQKLIISMNLHILVYIDIHIASTLNYLMFSKLACIQVCTHGHPVTSGVPRDLIDYYISWEAAELPTAQDHYTEKLILLPKSIVWEYYTPRNTPEKISELTGVSWGNITRDDLRNILSTNLITTKHWYFCSQASFKYHHSFIKSIHQILIQDPLGIFIMITIPKELHNCENILKNQFEKLNLLDRIIVVPKMKHHVMMAMYSLCDVVLDSFFFGGDTTTREGFEVGAPIVTLPSNYLGGRWTQAYYNIIGIGELIAKDENDYVDIAVKVATGDSNSLRDRILQNSHKLFYSKEAITAWENTFETMFKNIS
tara:strand:+ start:2131 stop:4536 length:2406 start_codon:yes stop_codon:yes gene_type:complete